MRKILTILLFFFSLSVWGTKYYVDPAGTDDAGRNGSISQPWAKVSYACTRVSAPDTIFINAGTINETTQIVRPLGVSIMGTGDGSHIVTTYTSASATQAAIQCASTAGTTTDDNGSLSYFRITGSSLTSGRAIYVGYRNYVKIHHVTIEDFMHGGVWLHISSSYPSLYSIGNEIYDCVINNSSSRNGDYFPAAIRVSGQDSCKIINNTLDMTERAAGDNGNTIEFQRCKRINIDDNTLYRLDHEIANWNFFLECWDYAGDFTYSNNIHYGFGKVSLGGEFNKQDPGCTFGAEVIGNEFHNPTVGYRTVSGANSTLYAINMEGDGHVNVTIARNYIQNYGVGIELSTPESGVGYWAHYWDWNNITVEYNVIDGVGYQDHAYSYGIWIVNETNLYPYYGVFNNVAILNNTVISNYGTGQDGYQGIGIYVNDTINNLKVGNNIASGFSSYGMYIAEHASDTLVITGLDVTHNCMNGNGTNTVYVESAAGRITITDSDVATGNITSDPLFVSTTNFRLQSTSPCIDAGIDWGSTVDKSGNRLYGDAYDIGAYEWGRRKLMNNGKLVTHDGKFVIIEQ